MEEVHLAAIVSSFNRLDLMQLGLPTLYDALVTCPFKSVIVVFDAGSTDGSQIWLKEFATGHQAIPIEVICPSPGEDTSFSAGVNFACSYVASKYSELAFYLFFETDNWISGPEPLRLACQLLEKEKQLAAVGFTVAKHSGEKAGYGCSFPTPWQFVIGHHLTYLFHLDVPHPEWHEFEHRRWSACDVVFTSPLLVRREAWVQSKGFDQKMFPFSDCDTDWCWRLKKLGWQLAVLEIDGVVHDNKLQLSAWSAGRAVQFHRGRLRLLKRNYGDLVSLLKPILFVRHCLEYLYVLLLVILKRRPSSMLEARARLIASVFSDYS
jgi:GT2 family glycosyltransferase